MLLSLLLLLLCALSIAYLYLFVIGSLLSPRSTQTKDDHLHRFAIAIPAHNEEEVIGRTVEQLQKMQYPKELFRVFVVADHCEDQTAQRAQAAGVLALERAEGLSGSKGAALRWLFQQIFSSGEPYDAVVIFDADTLVSPDFLQRMNRRLLCGAAVIQGNHIIANPCDGWFPALTWAMFLVDNRFQNLGRANLGCSAKNMGDAICFRADILTKYGWGEGLTEDYAFRQWLLLDGITIAYEPAAKSYGQAAWSWQVAQKQRLRWLKGAQQASRGYRGELWKKAWRAGSLAMLDGAAQGFMPSFSTLTLVVGLLFLINVALLAWLPLWLVLAWAGLFALLFVYPLLGLAFERAPLRAYLAILSGPVFVFWRTGLSLKARFDKNITWVRTPHRQEQKG